MEGLRERKKRETRDAIAAAALALFLERGYDAVTVVDVAVAANVSEKTVFNYFATKEDLVFANAEEKLFERAEAIRLREPVPGCHRGRRGGSGDDRPATRALLAGAARPADAVLGA
jgi:AcrR family transcriptional regulator